MKVLFYLLVVLPLATFCQNSEIKGKEIESLKLEYNNSTNDSAKVSILLNWDNLIYISDPELDFTLSKKIDSISRQHPKAPFFQKTRGFALNTMGIYHHSKAQYKEAVELYKQSLDLKIKIKDSMGIASSMSNIGVVYYEQGVYDSAFFYLKKGLTIERLINDTEGVSGSYNNLGNLFFAKGDYQKAIEYHTKSLLIDDEIGYLSGKANSLNNIGLIYFELEDYEQALDFYSKSLEIDIQQEDKQGIAFSKDNIGNIHEKLGNLGLAMSLYKESYQLNLEIESKKGQAVSLFNMANIAKQQGLQDSALNLYQKCLNIEISSGHERGKAKTLNAIGQIYYEVGKENLALFYCDQALETAQQLTFANETSEAAISLYSIYKNSSNYKSSLKMLELYLETRDSIINEESEKEVYKQQYEYSYAKKYASDSTKNAEQEKVKDAELNAERAISNQMAQQQYFLYSGLIVALLLGVFAFNRFRVTNRQKNIITSQKKIVDKAYHELDEKSKEIIDSINYAKHLQDAILPSRDDLIEHLKDGFVLYLPKNVISGDFYWLSQTENSTLVSVADCTGHGVPGAMVSVVCGNALNRSVNEFKISNPSEILNKTRDLVIDSFTKNGKIVKDGMDISLIKIPKMPLKDKCIKYSGANNPLWIVRDISLMSKEEKEKLGTVIGENYGLIEYRGDKQPVGFHPKQKSFTEHDIEVKENDIIYLFTDGFADQFGGEKGKKFKHKPFKEFLLSIAGFPMKQQKEQIQQTFHFWKGEIEQIDDVCILGFKIK